jgi:hypothetical protein
VQLITHLAQGKFNIYITTPKQSLLESTEITKENDSFDRKCNTKAQSAQSNKERHRLKDGRVENVKR